jgi:transcriptional regulator with GAF, ATPase, and Fis domain
VQDTEAGTSRAGHAPATALLVHILRGLDAGTTRIFDAGPIHIGRSDVAQLRLRDPQVSMTHVEIGFDTRGFHLRDLGSTNGTFVDELRVTEVAFEERVVVRVGHTTLELARVAPDGDDSHAFQRLVGESPRMNRLRAVLAQLAPSDTTVLVTGETGTGKELIAEALHAASRRRCRPLVVVDCSAIPAGLFETELFGHERGAFTGATGSAPGLFERAHGGTLFLDEIGELPLDLQPKLLRALQSKLTRRVGGERMLPCDVRVIAATNRDLLAEVARGAFRADLYYRIAVACVEAPALRERPGDVAILARHFARDAGGTLTDEQLAELERHAWPGNVRELRNAVERALCMPDAPMLAAAGPRAFMFEIPNDVSFKAAKQSAIDELDRRLLLDALDAHDWNITEAARATGLDRVTIYRMMQRLHITRRR